ncbi:replication regulatory protein RepA [Pantoea sp. Aalb]|uniref:replication regulatory protein RepA n=1 Tax=Pantoea sp. Aalb TaxID=2576762 RepID=UPI0013246CB7|nr:replication regulatory protein RepA [Pantoea sp. Aalb]MXP68008.1 replication regulatory protein RepA [Pantoea sp. Aalb]
MSKILNVITSSSKRIYKKGKPLSVAERQQALTKRRKETHKEIKVYVPLALKKSLCDLCQSEGISQAEMISILISDASIIMQRNK